MSSQIAAPRASWAVAVVVRALGAASLALAGGIHLHLYLTGYRDVPTIGPSFLLNAVLAAVAAVALLVVPRRWEAWVALGGGLLQAGTLAGLVVSLTIGLFGFTETLEAPFVTMTIVVEVFGALLLLGFAGASFLSRHRAT